MWVVFAVILLGGVVLSLIGWLGMHGRLPKQRVAGIRTPYTLSSEARWEATHRHGSPFLFFGGVATVAAAAALLPFALAGRLPDGFAIASFIALANLGVFSAVLAWVIGESRARRELGD